MVSNADAWLYIRKTELAFEMKFYPHFHRVIWPWCRMLMLDCAQEKRSLPSRRNFIPTFTELHGHGVECWCMIAFGMQFYPHFHRVTWPWCWTLIQDCAQGKRSLPSTWTFIRTFTELRGHGVERWPTEVTSNTNSGGSDVKYTRGAALYWRGARFNQARTRSSGSTRRRACGWRRCWAVKTCCGSARAPASCWPCRCPLSQPARPAYRTAPPPPPRSTATRATCASWRPSKSPRRLGTTAPSRKSPVPWTRPRRRGRSW